MPMVVRFHPPGLVYNIYFMGKLRHIAHLLEQVAVKFKEEDHPRDQDGKFARKEGRRSKPVPKGQDTQSVYMKDGKWDPERVKLHDGYVDTVSKKVPVSPVPTLYMTGGGPASGKSAGLLKNKETNIPGAEDAVHADPDGAKTFLPEYLDAVDEGDVGAGSLAHEESAHMSQRAVRESLGSSKDVVYDSSGDGGIEKLAKKVKQMRDSGAQKVVAHYATCDVEEAIRRSDKRGKEQGRYVPHDYLRAVHRDVAKTSLAAMEMGLFDSLTLWDTDKFPPTKIASYEKGKGLEILDKKRFEAYKKRGEG